MLLARCHIPGCLDTAGKRGFMCLTHWPLVPRELQHAHQQAVWAHMQWERGLTSEPPTVNHVDTGAGCIQAVLVLLWAHAFPAPEECVKGSDTWCCICPMCAQAGRLAVAAYLDRRHVDSRERA